MLFNSIDFAIFLPIVFILYWFVTNKNLKWQNLLIVAASYLFYGWWDWRFLSLILFSTIVDYSQFILYVLNGAELSESLQKELSEEQVRMNASKYWGLGFWVDENINENGDIALVNGGDDIGVHTIVFMLPKTAQGLIIFTNSDNGTDAFQEVVLKYLGENGQGIIKAEMK